MFQIVNGQKELEIMINMMNYLVQYVPYALFLAAGLLLLLGGLAYTVNYFRKDGRRAAKWGRSQV
jgi:hypothetical protein